MAPEAHHVQAGVPPTQTGALFQNPKGDMPVAPAKFRSGATAALIALTIAQVVASTKTRPAIATTTAAVHRLPQALATAQVAATAKATPTTSTAMARSRVCWLPQARYLVNRRKDLFFTFQAQRVSSSELEPKWQRGSMLIGNTSIVNDMFAPGACQTLQSYTFSYGEPYSILYCLHVRAVVHDVILSLINRCTG